MQKDTFVKTSSTLQCQKNRRDTHKTRKPLVPQLEATKPILLPHRSPLKKINIKEKCFEMISKKKFNEDLLPHSSENPEESSMLAKRFVSSKNCGWASIKPY